MLQAFLHPNQEAMVSYKLWQLCQWVTLLMLMTWLCWVVCCVLCVCRYQRYREFLSSVTGLTENLVLGFRLVGLMDLVWECEIWGLFLLFQEVRLQDRIL